MTFEELKTELYSIKYKSINKFKLVINGTQYETTWNNPRHIIGVILDWTYPECFNFKIGVILDWTYPECSNFKISPSINADTIYIIGEDNGEMPL